MNIFIIVLFILLMLIALLLVVNIVINCTSNDKLINKVGGGIVLKKDNLDQCPITNGVLTISENISEIDSNLFRNNKEILKINYLPRGIKQLKIGELSFIKCINLTELVIPPFINSIENNAFKNCLKLKKLIIYPPNSLDTLLYGTFFDGEYYPDSDYDISKTEYSEAIFVGCPIEYLVIPECIYRDSAILLRLFGTVDLTFIPTIKITNNISEYENLDTNIEGAAIIPLEGAAIMPSEGAAIMPSEGAAIMPSEGAAIMPSEVAAIMPSEGAAIIPLEGEKLLPDIDNDNIDIYLFNGREDEVYQIIKESKEHEIYMKELMASTLNLMRLKSTSLEMQEDNEIKRLQELEISSVSEYISNLNFRKGIWNVFKNKGLFVILDLIKKFKIKNILEVGAGAGLLSEQLYRCSWRVKHPKRLNIVATSPSINNDIHTEPIYRHSVLDFNSENAVDYFLEYFKHQKCIFIIWSRAREFATNLLKKIINIFNTSEDINKIVICAYTTGEDIGICENSKFYELLDAHKFSIIKFAPCDTVYGTENLSKKNDHLEIFILDKYSL